MVVLTALTSVLPLAARHNPYVPGRFSNKKAWLPGGRAFFFALLFDPVLLYADCTLAPAELQRLPQVEIRKVIDGDSVLLADGQQLRLIGVNAPELKTAEPLAREAQEYLSSLVSSRKLYLRKGEQQQDRYGRTLGHLYLPDGRNIESEMLRQGYGFLVAIPPNVALVACQQVARDQARGKQAGVWAEPAFRAVDGRKVTGDDVGFVQVTGKLLSVEQHDNAWWLQLEGLVVLHIAKKDQPWFSFDKLKALQERKVTASGWMVDRSKGVTVKKGFSPFMLLLTHPVNLEVL